MLVGLDGASGQAPEEPQDKVDIEQAIASIVDYLQAADTAGNRNGYVTRKEVSAKAVATGKRAAFLPLINKLVPQSGEFSVERLETELRQEMISHDSDANGRLTSQEFYHAVDMTRGVAERAQIRSAAENRLEPIVNLTEVLQDYETALSYYGSFNKDWKITVDQFGEKYFRGSNSVLIFKEDLPAEIGLISRRIVYLNRKLSGQQKEDLYQIIPEKGVFTVVHLQMFLRAVLAEEFTGRKNFFFGDPLEGSQTHKIPPVQLDRLQQAVQTRMAPVKYLEEETEFAPDQRFAGMDPRGLMIDDIMKEFENLLVRSTMSKREQKAFTESGTQPENIDVITWERLVDATQVFGNKFYDLGYGARTEEEFRQRYPAGIGVKKELERMKEMLADLDSPEDPGKKDGRLSLAELRRIKPFTPAPAQPAAKPTMNAVSNEGAPAPAAM